MKYVFHTHFKTDRPTYSTAYIKQQLAAFDKLCNTILEKGFIPDVDSLQVDKSATYGKWRIVTLYLTGEK